MEKKKTKGFIPQQLEKLENIRNLCCSGFWDMGETDDILEEILSETGNIRRQPFNKIRKFCNEALKSYQSSGIFDTIYWIALVDHMGKSIEFPKDIDIEEKLKYVENIYLQSQIRHEMPIELCDRRHLVIDEIFRRLENLEQEMQIERSSYLKSLIQ